jgi:hypothetical protein
MIGVQVPALVYDSHYMIILTPRLGIGWNTLSIHGEGGWASGVAFGGDLGFLLRDYHLGIAMGALSGTVEPPAELAAPYDFGGIYFTLSGGLDG